MNQKRLPQIDFKAINDALLSDVEGYARQWFGGGKRVNGEFQAPSTKEGGIGNSWSVNINTGVWSHFASGQSDGDMISLYAALHNMKPIEAARELASQLGMTSETKRAPRPQATPALASSDADKSTDEKPGYELVCPVPADAPAPHKAHSHRGKNIETIFTYYDGAAVLGYVYRFITSDGGKETLPHTLWRNIATGALEWKWWVWSKPRPVYRPTAQALLGERPVIVVEGEKCALNLDTFLFENGCLDYDVVSWVGGTGAVDKIDWQPLAGRTCILWPDADCKRVPLTPAERKLYPDEESLKAAQELKPYLAFKDQPGQKAMDKIAKLLHGLDCALSMIPLPAVASLPDGWDCADAIAAGWGLDKMLAQIGAAKELSRDAGLTRVTKLVEGAALDVVAFDWRQLLQLDRNGNTKPVRENVVVALLNDDVLKGRIRFNEFSSRIDVVKDLPWRVRGIAGAKTSEWTDVDSLHLGKYLCDVHWFPSVNTGALNDAVALAASSDKYHPIRDGLQKLKWDGMPRLDDWLLRCVVADPDALSPKTRAYISLVGRYFVMAMVDRVLHPGCKFDYVAILKGEQGIGKSTLFSVLGGEYFADTKIPMDRPKDAGEQIQGTWLLELGELAALNKAEANDIKAFVSSRFDRFRPAYGRAVMNCPRQTIFCGTTNDDTPLRDPTGSRRFWVVDVDKSIDVAYLKEVRMQLFAEAVARLAKHETYHPDYETEALYFTPEQSKHTRVSPFLEELQFNLTLGNNDWTLPSEWTVVALGKKLTGAGVDKVTASVQMEIGAAMKKLGWERKQRREAGGRIWVYTRPRVWPPVSEAAGGAPATASESISTGVSLASTNPINGDDDDAPF